MIGQALTQSQMNMIVLSVVLPLLAAFVVPLIGRGFSNLARLAGPITLVAALVISLGIWSGMQQPFMISLGGFAPPLGITFYVDHVAIGFSVLVLLMCLLLWPYQGQRSAREYSLNLLLASSGCGMALSGDLFNIYVFYELVSVASFGLAAAAGTAAAYAASIRYLIISGFGTVLALTGIALIYTQTGTLNLADLAQVAATELNNTTGVIAFVLILLGIGVKAELFPVNTWVPEVYATAGKRVSALLAGVVSKLAVLVLVRIMLLMFQVEQVLLIMLLFGLLGVIAGELAAWRARDMSRMLAYSSIGQLGMVFIAFSIPGSAGLYAGLALSLHHLLVKPALFLLAERWNYSLQGLAGAARSAPLAALLFGLFALSLIGVPPLPGFWAKLLLVSGLIGQDAAVYALALIVVLLATVLEANYLMRVAIRLYGPEQEQGPAPEVPAQGLNLATSALFAAALISTALFIAPLGEYLEQGAQQMADVDKYVSTVFVTGGAR